MVQCEMCGKETGSPNRVKIEGAELDVCDECTDFGTEVDQGSSSGSTSTKYSTGSSSSSSSSGSSSTGSTGGGGGSSRRSDMFDEMDEIEQDYDERIREAREASGLSQEDLAKKLNEKASLIRKLEHGDTLPSDEVRDKLESELGIDLSAGSTDDESDWSSDSAADGYTLGDVVERKDS